MAFNIKKYITENNDVRQKRLMEADIEGVSLTPEESDWMMFLIGPTSRRGSISKNMAIKLLQKDIRDGSPHAGEVAISKKLLKKISTGG